MRTGVAGAASARSLEACGDDSGSSSQLLKFRQQEFAVRAQRRAFALSASIEDVLVAAADRASERLKRERPEFSAATLNKLAYCIPLLFGVGALAALLTSVPRKPTPRQKRHCRERTSNRVRISPINKPNEAIRSGPARQALGISLKYLLCAFAGRSLR